MCRENHHCGHSPILAMYAEVPAGYVRVGLAAVLLATGDGPRSTRYRPSSRRDTIYPVSIDKAASREMQMQQGLVNGSMYRALITLASRFLGAVNLLRECA